MVNPMRALEDKAIGDDELPIQELSLGGLLTNWEETIDSDTRLTTYAYRDPLTTFVGKHPPTKNAKPRALFRVGDSYTMDTAKHCNFKGDDCWNVRVHPVVDKLSASEGSVLGGQELKISGFGLNGQETEVLVDGVICKVRSSTESEIICSTGEASQPSKTGYQPGSPGLIQTTIEP
jgi:hypothetical protein